MHEKIFSAGLKKINYKTRVLFADPNPNKT